MRNTTKRAIKKYGLEKCMAAFQMAEAGDGSRSIGFHFCVHTNAANAMINAGREVDHYNQIKSDPNVDVDQVDLQKIVIRERVSSRGGGVEIDLTSLGFTDQKMAAYQNYLGGGMLGSIQVNDTIRSGEYKFIDFESWRRLDRIGNRLKKHFFFMMFPDADDQDYNQIQKMPASAY